MSSRPAGKTAGYISALRFVEKYDNLKISERGTAQPPTSEGGDNMTVLEILSLLNLLAVVIFGVINVTKKK